jgi:ABC-2 type transport system permease protein
MNTILSLIKPRLKAFKNRGRSQKEKKKRLFLMVIGLLFWAAIVIVSYRVLSYFKNAEGVGDILAFKLLSMILIVFFSLLLFSSILTSLSKLYISKDLALVHSLPVRRNHIFLARWIESTVDSSWMVLVYAIPVFIVYGKVYEAGLYYYLNIFFSIFPLCVTASGVSVFAVLLTVVILPATRIRSIFVFLGLFVLIMLYLTFRMSRPERLVNPEAFTSALIYLKNLSTPSSPFLPSTWCFDALKNALTGNTGASLFHTAIALCFALFIIFLNITVADALYFKGFSKSQGATSKPIAPAIGPGLMDILLRRFSGPSRAFIKKEIKTFFRDQTQWSQIFLIFALIVIYVYNYSVLPLEKSPIKTVLLQNILSFLNMALAAFVLTSITARFTFPSISQEGSAFWIVRTSPISIRRFLWIKFFIYLIPFMILSQILIVATNIILHVSPFMMGLSVVTLFLLTPGVVSLGVGFGAAYPDFSAENPVQAVTSFGGLLFMIVSALFIGAVVILEAGPVYTVFMANMHQTALSLFHYVWFVLSALIALGLCVAALFTPMRFGEKKLLRMQQD